MVDISKTRQKYIALFTSDGTSKMYIEDSKEEAIRRAKNECGFHDRTVEIVVYETIDYHRDADNFIMNVIFERTVTPEDYKNALR